MVAQREWFEKDYYKVLGVPESVTDKDLTRAYRKLAKQFHPDANPGAEDRFKEISAAYEVLGDAEKRKEYDQVRTMGSAGFSGPGGFGAPGGGNYRVDDSADLGDIFGGLFGRGRRARAPQRGSDIEARLHLSFVDAVNGVTTAVHVPSSVKCHTCGGNGAKPGTQTHTCARCGGAGSLNDNQGLFSLSTICPNCSGRGSTFDTPCPNCHGTGMEKSDRQVKVRIPAGVTDGQRIKLKGKGNLGPNGGPAGDLFVVVTVASHNLFGRKDRNLTLTVPVTFTEAALGTTVTVPTLEDTVTLKIPAGTQPGTTMRVKGRGVPSSGKRTTGDLLVKVEVAVPKKLTDDEKAAIAALADFEPDNIRDHLGGKS